MAAPTMDIHKRIEEALALSAADVKSEVETIESKLKVLEKKLSTELQALNILERIRRTNGFIGDSFVERSEITIDDTVWPIDPVTGKELVSAQQLAELIPFIAEVIATDTACMSVELDGKVIQSLEHQEQLLKAISGRTHLLHVGLYNVHIRKEVFSKIAGLHLVSLELKDCSYSDTVDLTEREAKVLLESRTLKSLTLHGTVKDNVLAMLCSMPALEKIGLYSIKGITKNGFVALLKLNKFRRIELFPKDDRVFNDEEVKEVREALFTNEKLEVFNSSHPGLQTPYKVLEFWRKRVARNKNQKKAEFLAEFPECPYLAPEEYLWLLDLLVHLDRNVEKLPSNKITTICHNGIEVFDLSHCHPEASIILVHLKRKNYGIMAALGFSLNCFTDDNDRLGRNPYLNILIVNETHVQTIIELLEDPITRAMINPNEFDYEGKTVVIMAAKVYSADKVLCELLKVFGKKIKLNAKDKNGCTALHYVCAYGKKDLAEALLNLGADINARDFKGRTPLDYCRMPEATVKKILSNIDIDPERGISAEMNQDGRKKDEPTVIEACMAGHASLETFLLAKGAKSFQVPSPKTVVVDDSEAKSKAETVTVTGGTAAQVPALLYAAPMAATSNPPLQQSAPPVVAEPMVGARGDKPQNG